ncbi:unnamed protein product [Lepeophtheirus salmonis]|uniref:(salmon louse) hypothetical protein n=1 Tax=Lepeophtheirus salmonis TaxID=72036 RepID=A0A7R8CMV0_LEPSM|nr:unnamed protein product [Lepeophtheirus salmonis]CAF2869621.1 unnamed protein product [Lepeophtheirus salmonis]
MPRTKTQLDEKERKKYQHKATKVSRKQVESDSSSGEEQHIKVRPPLLDRAMTARALRKRKKYLGAKKRSAEKVSKTRQKSVNLRWEKGNNDAVVDHDFQPLEIEPPNVTSEKKFALTST